jgi:mannose-6-phosphate isomerase
MASVDLLEPVVQPYAWGSSVAIGEILGRPSPGPEAELWIGAHPSGPSGLRRDGRVSTLDVVIAEDPGRELGQSCVSRFGARLPFLLKVLAASRALSIQVHPDRAQAVAGYRAETERGILPGDPGRTYVDDWPKPEVLCALTPFEALAGFRAPADAAGLLEALAVDELAPLAARLRATVDPAILRDTLAAFLDWPEPDLPAILDRVVQACARLARGSSYGPACAAALRLAREHPDDPGLLASLLLRHVLLEPGEALFMPPRGIHAYLHGVGIEVLGNSDNVLRAALTPKQVNIPELLRVVDPAIEVPLLQPRRISGEVSTYDAGVPEFRLYRVDLGSEPIALPGTGPGLALCLAGDAVLRDDTEAALNLGRGGSAFIAAADGPVRATGPATMFLATVG